MAQRQVQRGRGAASSAEVNLGFLLTLLFTNACEHSGQRVMGALYFCAGKKLQGQQMCADVGAVAPGPAKLGWCGRGGCRASKAVVVWARWLQGQQSCAGVGAVGSGPTKLC